MFKGRKALVTGASRGIGFKIAEELVKNGARVVITGRNAESLKAAAEKIGENAIPLVWDASDINIAKTRLRDAALLLGGLDIIVNNAGTFTAKSEKNSRSLLEITQEEWQYIMNTNASGLFFTMQAGVKYMLENGVRGNVLNISSIAGNEPICGAYQASKIVATGLTRGWGRMFAPDGITINGIAPGPVATEMNNWHEGDSMVHKHVPYGRFASVEEIARLALYLLSDDAKMICGDTVVIDGAFATK